ncbi:DUF6087 family protein [Streptomyces sp. NPDC048252]|uniref:DUF6087 family protein n=1 Tax=Streptomyces sp. NPDC048252 TaxID=3154612 RepID=UPI003417381D
MDDEPLNEWVARREASRPKLGDRQVVPLGEGHGRGGHVDPDAQRGVLEWDGHQWVPAGVAEDHATAGQEVGPQDAAERVALPRFSALPPAPERPFRPTQVFRRP